MRQPLLWAPALALLLSGCAILGIGADADVRINQSTWESAVGYQVVTYTITNTGRLYLRSISVTFKATCADGTSYRYENTSFDIAVGQSKDEYVWIDTLGRPATEVTVYETRMLTW